jgi:hypothetical protein
MTRPLVGPDATPVRLNLAEARSGSRGTSREGLKTAVLVHIPERLDVPRR